MKLYFSPAACSLSPHILLRECGLTFELEKVDTERHRTADGRDFYAINPKGQVPVLELAEGSRLTEGPVIAQYIADHAQATLAALLRKKMDWLDAQLQHGPYLTGEHFTAADAYLFVVLGWAKFVKPE